MVTKVPAANSETTRVEFHLVSPAANDDTSEESIFKETTVANLPLETAPTNRSPSLIMLQHTSGVTSMDDIRNSRSAGSLDEEDQQPAVYLSHQAKALADDAISERDGIVGLKLIEQRMGGVYSEKLSIAIDMAKDMVDALRRDLVEGTADYLAQALGPMNVTHSTLSALAGGAHVIRTFLDELSTAAGSARLVAMEADDTDRSTNAWVIPNDTLQRIAVTRKALHYDLGTLAGIIIHEVSHLTLYTEDLHYLPCISPIEFMEEGLQPESILGDVSDANGGGERNATVALQNADSWRLLTLYAATRRDPLTLAANMACDPISESSSARAFDIWTRALTDHLSRRLPVDRHHAEFAVESWPEHPGASQLKQELKESDSEKIHFGQWSYEYLDNVINQR